MEYLQLEVFLREKRTALCQEKSQRCFAMTILGIAHLVSNTILGSDPMPQAGIKRAIELAEKNNFEEIEEIVTEKLQKHASKPENATVIKARSFLRHAIIMASCEIQPEEYSEYFQRIREGMEVLYQFDSETDWITALKNFEEKA